MASAYGSVGFAVGVPRGLESARQRRYVEEDRKIAAQQRDQADVDRLRRHQLEDVQLEGAQATLARARRADEREPTDIEYQNRLREQQLRQGDLNIEGGEINLDTARLGLAGARRTEANADEELRRRREREDLAAESGRFALDRQRTEAGNADKDRALQEQQVAASNIAGVVHGLSQGMDPEMLRSRFNEQSPRKIQAIEYDPQTRILSMTDQDGNHREAPIDAWAKAYPPPPEALTKLGKDDRLVNARGETVVGPDAAAGGADISPYNPTTVGGQLRGDIVRSAGGQLGPLGEIMGIADPDARRLVDFQVAEATAMEGRLRQLVASGRVGTGEISRAVIEATKGMPTEAELARKAEAWRTDPTFFNRSQDQAAQWIATERTKARAEAAAKLATAEQELMTRRGRPSFTEKPSWAGNPVQGVDPKQLESGYEYDVEIDGRKATIRLGPDGQVYEVGGQPQASNTGSGRATNNRVAADVDGADTVNTALADARRGAGSFVY